MSTLLLGTLDREMKLYFRRRGEWCQPLIFFIIITGVFALMLGKSPIELRENAVGILWTSFVLGLILSQESVFYADYEAGVLEQVLLSPQPKIFIILAKIFAHSIFIGLPLIFLALVSGYLFEVKIDALLGIALALLLSLPSISLVGAISGALTLSLKRGGIMLAILVLPLMAPIVLFGASASYAACNGMDIMPHLAILGALLLLFLVLAPITCLFALEISGES